MASAVRESTEVLQAQECEDVASPLLLNSLHHSLVAHVSYKKPFFILVLFAINRNIIV